MPKVALSRLIPKRTQLKRLPLYFLLFFASAYITNIFPATDLHLSSAWNLSTGLLLALLLIEGASFALFAFASLVFGSLLVNPPGYINLPILITQTFLTTAAYAILAEYWAHRKFDPRLITVSDTTRLTLMTALVILFTVTCNTLLFVWTGALHPGLAAEHFLHSWIGEALGILSITPVLIVFRPEFAQLGDCLRNAIQGNHLSHCKQIHSLAHPFRSAAYQIIGMLLVLLIVFGWQGQDSYRPFYLCFIPLIWISLTRGIPGAVMGLAIMNGAMMWALHISNQEVAYSQAFMLVFSVSSLFLGSAVTERENTEFSLRVSEGNLRSIFNDVYDAIIIHDLDGSILDVNPQLLNMYQLTADEAGSILFFQDYSAPEFEPEELTAHWQAALRGEEQLFEWKSRRPKDGTRLDVEVYLSRLPFADRFAILATLRDITKRKNDQRLQSALTSISQSASTAANLQALFQDFHAAVSSIMPASNFYICLYEESSQLLSFPYYADEFDSAPSPQALGNGLTEYVLRSGKPILVTPSVFDQLVASNEVESHGADCIDWLGIPLKVQDRTIGIMAIQSYSDDVRFRQEDLDFLVLVSPHIAMATEHKRAEETLQQQHDFIKTIFDSSPDAILTVDLLGLISDCNQATLDLMRVDRKDEIIGKSAIDFIDHCDRENVLSQLNETLSKGIVKHVEFRLIPTNERETFVEMSVSTIRDENDAPIFLVGHLVDITLRKRAEEALRISEERYSLAMLGANDGLWDWDLVNQKVYYSPRWKSMLGYDDQITNNPEEWFQRVHPEDITHLKSDIEAHLAGWKPQLENEYRMLHRNGEYRWMEVRGIAVSNYGEKPHRLAGSQTDITDRKRSEQRLIHEALHDALTALPNRVLFMDRLEQAIRHNTRHPSDLFAVLFLDLDRFKVVNDSLGHMAGDELLIKIARRLETCLRGEDTVARLGGDEFAILLNDLADPLDSIQIAARIEEEVSQQYVINNQQVFTTVSIGIALSETGYESAEDVLRDADTAMYQAKALGGGRHVVFDKHMHTEAVELLRLETDLRQALENNQFRVYYQPIYSLKTSQVVGAEALIRWKHPVYGLRYPSEFIELAEETGLILPIGEWVLKTACHQLKKWQMMGMDMFKIAVNLSARQFQHLNLPHMVRAILIDNGLLPIDLELEITESIEFIDVEGVDAIVHELNQMGVGVSVDDFGTGYSSLTTLRRLNITNIKIAQSFISAISKQNENDMITASIIQMAHNLGYQVVAEGVETPEQLNFLRSENCDLIQGYLISPPVSAEEFEMRFFRAPGVLLSFDPLHPNLVPVITPPGIETG